MVFNDLNISQKSMLYNYLIDNFDIDKVYKLMCSNLWDGYKPIDNNDIIRIIDEISETVILEKSPSCSTAGLEIGIIDNVFYVFFRKDFSIFDTTDMLYIELSDVFYYFDYVDLLRKLKIKKIQLNVNKKKFIFQKYFKIKFL